MGHRRAGEGIRPDLGGGQCPWPSVRKVFTSDLSHFRNPRPEASRAVGPGRSRGRVRRTTGPGARPPPPSDGTTPGRKRRERSGNSSSRGEKNCLARRKEPLGFCDSLFCPPSGSQPVPRKADLFSSSPGPGRAVRSRKPGPGRFSVGSAAADGPNQSVFRDLRLDYPRAMGAGLRRKSVTLPSGRILQRGKRQSKKTGKRAPSRGEREFLVGSGICESRVPPRRPTTGLQLESDGIPRRAGR